MGWKNKIWYTRKLSFRQNMFLIRTLYLPCFLWKLRGLKQCDAHGFYKQSWITGVCHLCEQDFQKYLEDEREFERQEEKRDKVEEHD